VLVFSLRFVTLLASGCASSVLGCGFAISSHSSGHGFSTSGYSISSRGSAVLSRGSGVPGCGAMPTRAPGWRSAWVRTSKSLSLFS
jgi:hypothetical protein